MPLKVGVLVAALLSGLVAITAAAARVSDKVQVITYGQALRLTGTVPKDQLSSMHTVTVLAQACRFTQYARVGVAKVGPTGAYSFQANPTIGTAYSVRGNDLELSSLVVRVRPIVSLTKGADGRFTISVTTAGGTSLGGRSIVVEQSAALRGPWKRLATPKLKLTSPPDALDAVSASTTAIRGRSGAYLRARLTPGGGGALLRRRNDQAGQGITHARRRRRFPVAAVPGSPTAARTPPA